MFVNFCSGDMKDPFLGIFGRGVNLPLGILSTKLALEELDGSTYLEHAHLLLATGCTRLDLPRDTRHSLLAYTS